MYSPYKELPNWHIVRRLVYRHDGEIDVDSRPGRTEFCVSLPIVTATGPSAARRVGPNLKRRLGPVRAGSPPAGPEIPS